MEANINFDLEEIRQFNNSSDANLSQKAKRYNQDVSALLKEIDSLYDRYITTSNVSKDRQLLLLRDIMNVIDNPSPSCFAFDDLNKIYCLIDEYRSEPSACGV